MTAGFPVVYAWAQGPAAKISWLSSRVWARWSEALAQRSWPSSSASMIPAAWASNSCLAARTACRMVAGRSRVGSRSFRVLRLLASTAGSIGMRCAFGSGRRTGEPGQQARREGPGCRSGPTAPRSRVGSSPIPAGTGEDRRLHHTPQVAGAGSEGEGAPHDLAPVAVGADAPGQGQLLD